MPRRWSDVFTLISQRKAGHCGGKTTPADERTWEGIFDGQPICVVSTVRLLAIWLTFSPTRARGSARMIGTSLAISLTWLYAAGIHSPPTNSSVSGGSP